MYYTLFMLTVAEHDLMGLRKDMHHSMTLINTPYFPRKALELPEINSHLSSIQVLHDG